MVRWHQFQCRFGLKLFKFGLKSLLVWIEAVCSGLSFCLGLDCFFLRFRLKQFLSSLIRSLNWDRNVDATLSVMTMTVIQFDHYLIMVMMMMMLMIHEDDDDLHEFSSQWGHPAPALIIIILLWARPIFGEVESGTSKGKFSIYISTLMYWIVFEDLSKTL